MPANKIKISVCGSDYVISSTDSEEYVLDLAEKLNGEMQAFLKVNESSSVTAAAVLSALGYMDELQKTINGADNMRGQIKDYLEDAAHAKMEAEEAKRALEAANVRIEQVRMEAERLKREMVSMQVKSNGEN